MVHFVWLWVVALALSIIAEVVFERLIAIWGIPASIVGIVFALCDIHIGFQILAVVLAYALGFFALRSLLNKGKTKKTCSIDEVIGEKCVVYEKIDNFAGQGLVKIKGTVWSARGVSDDDVFEVGESLTVVAIEGVKLVCKK